MYGIVFVKAGGKMFSFEKAIWKADWTNIIGRKNFRCIPNLLTLMAVELPNGVY